MTLKEELKSYLEARFEVKIYKEDIDDILSLIRSHLLKAIPKEKDMFEPGAVQMWRDGYNSALSEVKKAIEEEMR